MAVLLLFVSDVTYSTDFLVNKICFIGLQRVSLNTALHKLSFKIGDVIQSSDIANSIKMLFFTGCFKEICISRDDGVITITVTENPIINKITFHGNKVIKPEMIQHVLDMKKIKVGQPLNNSFICEALKEFKDIYHSIGKFNAIVKINPIILPKNCVDLKVVFYEGNTAKINSITILGNQSFSQKKLFEQCNLYKKTWWNNTLYNNEYDQQKIFYGLEKLRTFYLNHGYAKFYIDEPLANLSMNKEKVEINLRIFEGSRYFFDSVILHGNVLKYFPSIKRYLQISSEKLYSNSAIEQMGQNIRYLLGKHGYIQPDILIDQDFNEKNKTVKLHLYIDVGKRFYVREICCEGNNLTEDSVIRREVRQAELSPLNYIHVLKDQEQLRRLGYFKEVNARIEPVPDTINQIDLIYNIEERNTGNLNISIGLGKESGLNIQSEIHQDNFLGTGNAISVTITKNYCQSYIDMLMLKRYSKIRGDNISGKVFYNNLFSDKMNLSNYNMKNYGVNVDYLYPLNKRTSCNIGLNYISNHLNKIVPQVAVWRYLDSIGKNPAILTDQVNPLTNINSINFYANDFLIILGQSFNNLNHIFFPEFGSNTTITCKLTLPGSDNKYYKLMINSSYYYPLDDRAHWVLMSAICTGYSGSLYNQKTESPFFDNFCIGGIGTVRGFRLNSIGPKAAYYQCNNSNTNYSQCSIRNSYDTIGGNAVVFIKNELIMPILWMNNTKYDNVARISLFIDSGTVWDTYWENTQKTQYAGILDYSIFGHIRISSGISLKWISPIGPIIFSYSKLIQKYPGDMEEVFQFTIGKTGNL
ncbi:outer membrane protein assembly factor YaeT [Candidatus Blochmanniella vafra str. BVAF]|uniref:Outer membrane protein assembly factor BamA n=2 Tax=Candidatus Blochmanniella vafra TaxID=251535 RepID=E8Q6T3_BLOVB|nr:outer membrane protein assembly factor YaeT [Candidatus Blochmannia vafer str. BVAF]